MSNSVSPLLTEIDVHSFPHSFLSLEFDEVSPVIFHMGLLWFMWKNHIGDKIGIASCIIDERGGLTKLRKWPLPMPARCTPVGCTVAGIDFQIAALAGNYIAVVITVKHDGGDSYLSGANSVVYGFSPVTERWYVGAYGKVTGKFKFHPIEKPSDISSDVFDAVKMADSLRVYTEGDELLGYIDAGAADAAAFLSKIFQQKMDDLAPTAAAFIYLNNDVPYDKQISEPVGGRTVFLPGFEKRVLLLHNFEKVLGAAKPSFKWPGVAVERDDDIDIAFTVFNDGDTIWKTGLINLRLPIEVVRSSSMVHGCGRDIFRCVYGLCGPGG